MAGHGVPHDDIACVVRDGIDSDTLKKHIKKELMQGKARAKAEMGKTIFQKGISGDMTAAIWYSKTQMGWKDTSRIEVTDGEGSPFVTAINIKVIDPQANNET
jgi:hypothetical protein